MSSLVVGHVDEPPFRVGVSAEMGSMELASWTSQVTTHTSLNAFETGDDILRFHTVDRQLFNRLVGRMGKVCGLTKTVIAVWLVLEELGHHELIRTIFAKDDFNVEALFNETVSCLNYMDPNTDEQPTNFNDTPVLSQILTEQMNCRFFYYNRDFLRNKVNHVMNTICSDIFDGNMAKEDDIHPSNFGPFCGEGSSTLAGVLDSTDDQIASLSLNPLAKPFNVGESSSKDQRSMFLTFSNGYPLGRKEISDFFNTNWGPVVEEVLIERTAKDTTPQFGRVVFKNVSVVARVLNGQSKVKFIVNEKQLWARIYSPRKNKSEHNGGMREAGSLQSEYPSLVGRAPTL